MESVKYVWLVRL